MYFFDANPNEMIDLYKVEAVRFDGQGIVTAVINGRDYLVLPEKHKEFFDRMSNVEKGISLTQKYVSL
jgi:hypothetical protein